MKKVFCIMASAVLFAAMANAAVGFATQPYLQTMTPTSVTIMWVTSGSKQVTGWVEYGEGNSTSIEAFDYTRGLKQAFTNIYRVHLTNLTPGTTYSYKAKIREITGFVGNTSLTWGDTYETSTYTFTTPAADATSASCVILSDIHSQDTCLHTLLERAGITMRDYDFLMLNGDMLNAVPNEAEVIHHLLVPYADLTQSSMPFFFTRGNHEYRNKFARHLLDYVETGEDNEGFYAFSWGPCRFIVLDTGEDKADSDKEYNGLVDTEAYRALQVDWLREQLASDAYREAKFKIIFMHIPFYSNTATARYAVEDCRNLFLPLVCQYAPDVVISGHTHKAGVLEADAAHPFPIVFGGGKDFTDNKRDYCPAAIVLRATDNAMELNVINYYGENKGTVRVAHKAD